MARHNWDLINVTAQIDSQADERQCSLQWARRNLATEGYHHYFNIGVVTMWRCDRCDWPGYSAASEFIRTAAITKIRFCYQFKFS